MVLSPIARHGTDALNPVGGSSIAFEAFAWNEGVELACDGPIKERERRGELKITPYSSEYLVRFYARALT
jgi:hypothetical protein